MKRLAHAVIDKHGTNCPYKIAQEKGIIVIAEPLGKLNGHFSNLIGQPFIHVNDRLNSQIMNHIVSYLLLNDLKKDFNNKISFPKHSTECSHEELSGHQFALTMGFTENSNIVLEKETIDRMNYFMKHETSYWNATDKVDYILSKFA